ncbi:hypothetical protein AGOR_G00218670 [Albula goreensis]|uniref:ATP-binding cassette sub-family A member 12 n=1 Tax=Albula goreensis TaxID=1534307 RepID=A0A8T3CPU1_9TELE|nr:hypothetical protein AGOR_G00218670 [Albula goreensis]
MASFFKQLRLLLWKNFLGVIRQPGWSVALLVWPLVIFIILAITRSQFPPKLKYTCYVAPRNLPSAGFFPFLQTLMCNTDSTCSNKSHLVGSRSGASLRSSWKAEDAQRLSLLPFSEHTFADIQKASTVHAALLAENPDQSDMVYIWHRMLNSSHEGIPNKTVIIESLNTTFLENQEVLDAMLESVNMLKRSLCNVSLSILDVTVESPIDPFSYGLVTFCRTNDTLLEVFLLTLNQVMTELLLNNPVELLDSVGETLLLYDQLQLQNPLWEAVLGLPRLFLPSSVEEVLEHSASLLHNIKRTLSSIQSSFPHVPLTIMNPALDEAITFLNYMSKWPGRDVYIRLSDVTMMPAHFNLSATETDVISRVKVPLHKATVLMDYPSFHYYVCDVAHSCGGERLHRVFGLIRQDRVMLQMVQLWSQHVASSDVAILTRTVENLLRTYSPENQGLFGRPPASLRNSGAQPLSPQDQLFLDLGTVALDLLRGLPGGDYVMRGLMVGYTSMELVTKALETQQGQMEEVLTQAHRIQKLFMSLMRNETVANVWVGRAMESTLEMLFSHSMECKDLLSTWAWLSDLTSVPPQLLEAVLCSNMSLLDSVVLAQWAPVVSKGAELVGIVEGTEIFSVTAPMLLSNWYKLVEALMQFGNFFEVFFDELDEDYWAAWMPHPDNNTVDLLKILIERGVEALVTEGLKQEKDSSWLGMETYFHIAYWIMTFQPNVTAPPNCAVDPKTMVPLCHTGFTWEKFVPLAVSLMEELSVKPTGLVRFVQGSLAFLQGVYGQLSMSTALNLLSDPELLPGDGSIQNLLKNLIQLLNKDIQVFNNILPLDHFDSKLSLSILSESLQVLGLGPLEALWTGSLNDSDIITAIIQAAQNNQHLLTSLGLPENQTDPSLSELEALVFRWLSGEGRLSLPLSLGMADLLLTYTASLNSADLEYLREVLHPLTNQSARGVSEVVLQAMQVLKQVIEAQGDPTVVILGYLHQLQDFLISALQLESYTQILGPNGVSQAQMINLRPVAMDIIQLLQKLSATGDPAVLETILRHLGGFLPPELHPRYEELINQTHILIGRLSSCVEAGLACQAEVSHAFQILTQASQALLQTVNGTVSIELIPGYNPQLSGQGDLPLSVTVDLLSLMLLWTNQANESLPLESTQKTATKTLHFLQQIFSTPDISLDSLQRSLRASNLTLGELDMIARVVGSTNASALLADLMGIVDVQQCFQIQPKNVSLHAQLPNPTEANCALELIMRTTGFLQGLSMPQETKNVYMALHYLIQFWASEAVGKGQLGALISSPGEDQLATSIKALTILLENIQVNLRDLLPGSWPQIKNEVQMLEGLLYLANETFPFNDHNSTNMNDSFHLQMEVMEWLLRRLQNVSHGNSVSLLLYPMVRMAEMQLAYQIAQTQFQVFVQQETEELIQSVQLPLNGTDLSKIGHYAIGIIQAELQLLKENIELQMGYYEAMNQSHMAPDVSFMNGIEAQVVKYLNLIQTWLRDTRLTSAIANMLQLGTGSSNLNPGEDQLATSVNSLTILLGKIQENIHSLVPESWQQIKNEIQVLEGLLHLANETFPMDTLNSTDLSDPLHFQRVYSELTDWYLKRLQEVSHGNNVSVILNPIIRMAEVQLAYQFAQSQFQIFVQKEIEELMQSVQLPLNGTDLSKIGHYVVSVIQAQIQLVKENIELQVDYHEAMNQSHMAPDVSFMNEIEAQVMTYLNLTQNWLKDPNLSSAITSVLQMDAGSLNLSAPGLDISQLFHTLAPLLPGEQQAFLAVLQNVSLALNHALLVASQDGGVESDEFLGAIFEAVRMILGNNSTGVVPLPDPVLTHALSVLRGSLKLILNPEMSYMQARELTLEVLSHGEGLIQAIVPPVAAPVLMQMTQAVTAYLEIISEPGGPDKWNQL